MQPPLLCCPNPASQLAEFLGAGQDGDLQVAVFGAQLVDKGLFLRAVLHPDFEGEAEHAAHAGGLGAHLFDFGQIARKNLVKGAAVFQRLGDRDAQQLILLALGVLEERRPAQQQNQQRQAEQDQHAIGEIAHAEGDAGAHAQQDRGDLVGGARRAAEADQPEGAAHGDARADVAVDEGDDRRHDKGDQGGDQEKALGRADAEAHDPGENNAAEQGDPRHQKELRGRDRRGIYRVKHSKVSFQNEGVAPLKGELSRRRGRRD